MLDLNSNKRRCYELTAFYFEAESMKYIYEISCNRAMNARGVMNLHVKWNCSYKPSWNPWNGKKNMTKLKIDNDANTTCHFCCLWLDKTLDWPLLVTNIGKPTALCELTVFAAYIEFNTIPFWFPLPHRMSLLKEIACDNCVISILFTKEAWGQGNVDI